MVIERYINGRAAKASELDSVIIRKKGSKAVLNEDSTKSKKSKVQAAKM